MFLAAAGICLLAVKLAVVRPGVLSPVSIPLRPVLLRPEAIIVVEVNNLIGKHVQMLQV